jgi:large subunit ribosomal protein L25
MATYTLEGTTRTALGKRAKDVMKERKIPAIVYGHGVDSRPIAVPASDFRRVFQKAGSSALIDLAVDGAAPAKTLIKEVQYHPTRNEPIHVDFLQVKMTEKMRVTVPIVFTGESEAIKALGGTLVKGLDHVEVECLPADLPHEITVDIGVLKTFDDSITVADLALPKGVQVETHGELTIAFVERPMTEEEMKKLEESQLGDVTAVKTEADEKKEGEAEGEAAPAAESEGKNEA